MVSMVSVDQTNRRQKDRPQHAITHFFTSGGQVDGSAGPSNLSEDTIMSAIENLDLTNLMAELPQAGIMSLGGVLEAKKLQPGVKSRPAETGSLADLTETTTGVVSLGVIKLQKDNELEIHKEGIQDSDDKQLESHIKGTSTRNSKEPVLDGGPIAEGHDEEIGETEWNGKNMD
ncbi:hypothetical protein NDU88_000531 [Pleurodeles waltl]|uniref:Uncharacterized protein n=1 Tax=Pleurodeles waltl TaxID=8319 RepID=A0AAV7S6E0_PLEWA|nr:hypothetical protein NDU88_000531 [Pleurodeles waltl]